MGSHEFPDISSIIEFSIRLRTGVSQKEAEKFIKSERRKLHVPQAEMASVPTEVPINHVHLRCYFGQKEGASTYDVLMLGTSSSLGLIHLEYFLKNWRTLPERWRYGEGGVPARIFFWSLFNDEGAEVVEYMHWTLGEWVRGARRISDPWCNQDYLAVYDPPF